MNQFLSGAVMMGFLVGGLFFLKFYRQTRDRLFALFALAFWILAVNRIGLAFTEDLDELRTWFYVVRLVAFLVILAAIIDKNRRPRGS